MRLKIHPFISELTLLTPCFRLADLLHLPAPVFPTLTSSKGTSSVLVLDNNNPFSRGIEDIPLGGMWEDDEQRRFYEDVPDLAELVPAGLLGVEKKEEEKAAVEEQGQGDKEKLEEEKKEREMMEAVQRELEGFEKGGSAGVEAANSVNQEDDKAAVETESSATSPKVETSELCVSRLALAQRSPNLVLTNSSCRSPPPASTSDDPATSLTSGPLARLNAVFAALPDASSKTAIDQLTVDFAFLNSKASRKRLIKVRVPSNNTLHIRPC